MTALLGVLVGTSGTTRAEGEGVAATGDPAVEAAVADPRETSPFALERPLRRSHFWAATHLLGVNAAFSIVGLSIGKEYLKISPSSIGDNLTSDWVWDEDAFDTNQFGHPYLGGLMFNAARSNGVGFWGAALYTFVGSAFWELVMETETPSINDQIFTPTAGILFGEALHRFGRAIRWNHGQRPSLAREILAAAVDPMGFVSRVAHGDAWALTAPPPRFGYLAIGWNGFGVDFEQPSGERFTQSLGRVHLALGNSYGLPVDPAFRPRRPLDHHDFRIEGSISREGAELAVHTRGLLWGRAFGLGPVRAIGGIMASYDFTNPQRVRIGAFGLGAGVVFHAPLGDVAFLQGTLAATAIPFGAAGSDVDEDAAGGTTDRDYHRGPGTAQVLELKLGRPGLGLIHLTSRSFVINGSYFDEGSEVIDYARFGVLAAIRGHHAIGVEGALALRRANFAGEQRDLLDTSAQFRISYVFASDLAFGGDATR
jgi:hypothetical protein